MSDIEKLIERLRAKRRGMTCDDYDAILGEAADALTRLVAPLPAEVAAFVCDLDEAWVQVDSDLPRDPAARMLESLARENGRLAALLTKSSEDNDAWIELLAERDRLAADNRRLDMGMDAANRLSQYEEGLRLGIEADRDRLAAENAELRVTSDIHGQDACKLEIDVSSLRTELAECKAQNRAMAETMSAFAKLDATAECTCTLTWTFYAGSDAGRAARDACPVHAPKPAAEKP